jgi:hypothetical protein
MSRPGIHGGCLTEAVYGYLRAVLRARLVAFTTCRTDFLSRWDIRSTLPIMSVVIILDTALLKKAAG